MSFTDFIKLQNDAAHVLLADADLDSINVVTRHRLIQDESRLPDKTLPLEVLAYITPRNGRKGCGIIVETPEVSVDHPNLPGPECFVTLTFLILEERLTNLGPTTGTLQPADQVAQRILELFHGILIEGSGDYYADRNAIQAAKDFEPLDAFRVRVRTRMQRNQAARCALPTIAENAGTVTLTAGDDSAVWFTTDDSFPAPTNSKAQLYSEPFSADAGTVLRWAAYSPTRPQSHVGKATVT